MQPKDVKTIIKYYHKIPEMVKLLKSEWNMLEDQYDGLRGMSMDGMPHGTAPGKPTEELALKQDSRGTWERMQEIGVRIQVYKADAVAIRGCLDGLNGKYKSVISMRNLNGYSWARISIKLSAPDGTVRGWYDRAVERLGEGLEDVPMVDEILGRASRARD